VGERGGGFVLDGDPGLEPALGPGQPDGQGVDRGGAGLDAGLAGRGVPGDPPTPPATSSSPSAFTPDANAVT
jgi:hypothetical protein